MENCAQTNFYTTTWIPPRRKPPINGNFPTRGEALLREAEHDIMRRGTPRLYTEGEFLKINFHQE